MAQFDHFKSNLLGIKAMQAMFFTQEDHGIAYYCQNISSCPC